MGELGIRLRAGLGAFPVVVERVWRAAVGGWPAWRWLPVVAPYLVAGAAALAVGALAVAIFRTAADYPPLAAVGTALLGAGLGSGAVGVLRPGATFGHRFLAASVAAVAGWIGGTVLADTIIGSPLPAAGLCALLTGLVVLGWRLQIARSAAAAAGSVRLVPTIIAGLVVLATLPALQAAAEIIITRATVTQFVERRVGTATLIEMEGLVVLVPFEAEAPVRPDAGPDPGPHHWLAIRAGAGERQFALVRSTFDPSALSRRSVVGRVTENRAAVDAAASSLRRRGVQVGASPVPLLLVALAPAAEARAENVRELRSAAELGSVAPGSVVRVRLDFTGEGVAACEALDTCRARRLGQGIGPWDQLAHDAAGSGSVVVRTPYAPSAAPWHVYGRHLREPAAVDRFLALPWVRQMFGWAHVLRAAILEHDPSLPVDRLWLGPILFMALAALLWLGRRVGYPIFTPVATWTARPGVSPHGQVHAVASGRITPPGRSPVTLDEAAVTLRRSGSDTVMDIPGAATGRLAVPVPHALGALSDLEVGELRFVSSRRPAVHVSWYGSMVALAFTSSADRDAAAGMLRGGFG